MGKLLVLTAAFFGAALAHPDYPELYDKVYMHIQHGKKDENEVYAKIRLRWDEYPGASEYQVCRNCHIDQYGHETDKSMGSLYSFKSTDNRDIDPYFICDAKRDRHHCIGHIYQAGLKVSYFSVRAKKDTSGLDGALLRDTKLIQPKLTIPRKSKSRGKNCKAFARQINDQEFLWLYCLWISQDYGSQYPLYISFAK